MLIALLIATSFSVGFFFESVIGFGGSLIAYSILGYFMDLKEMVLAAIYIGTCSSAYIAYSGFKFFDKKTFQSLIPVVLVGVILGVLIFSKFSSQDLAPIMGSLLIFLALKTIFFDKISLPKFLRNKLLLIGGIVHGAFGIGGPFVVNAVKDEFKNKSALRATMALFFVMFNVIRLAQLSFQGQLKWEFFAPILWTIIPVLIAIKIGHLVHLKISEETFKKGVALMTIFAGIKFLL